MDNFTVVSHIYNEEYLLPFWLEHHSKIFKHGIIIDYYSTDASVDIITKLCPTWKIIKTKNVINGKPNFEAVLVDNEVKEIEKTIIGNKITLNTTEFLFMDNDKIHFDNIKKYIYKIRCHSVYCLNNLYLPDNLTNLFKNINYIYLDNRANRYLHNHDTIDYRTGRHDLNCVYNNILSTDDIFILHIANYNLNSHFIKRKMQIQNNIPDSDKIRRYGVQHILNSADKAIEDINLQRKKSVPINNYSKICNIIKSNINKKHDMNIYYCELIKKSNWGNYGVMLNNDINLLSKTDFNDKGYKCFKMSDHNNYLKKFVTQKINELTGRIINIEKYHELISEEEHKNILHNMPYKKECDEQFKNFCNYLEDFVSDITKEKVKIFNNDVWVRICRPSDKYETDYNPYHKDIYLNFYRNVINIYIPIVGSNEKSSLTLQEGSHLWNENIIMITDEGAYFENDVKKYSVSAIAATKIPLNICRPNPMTDELLLFSPYLIHGGALNENKDVTRFSLEVRFIKDDNNSYNQEKEYLDFLSKRYWR